MSLYDRQDSIKIKTGVVEKDFASYMPETFIPFFTKTYQKPARVNSAALINQKLFKDSKEKRQYIRLNALSVPLPALTNMSLKDVVIISKSATDDMLAGLMNMEIS